MIRFSGSSRWGPNASAFDLLLGYGSPEMDAAGQRTSDYLSGQHVYHPIRQED
jgi:hypothetical protein